MRRIIVNVGVGRWYPRGQARLRDSLQAHGDGAELHFYGDWPSGAPAHSVLPFAFKAHAMMIAKWAGADSILWLDCSCWAVKSLAPLWAKIERDGFCFINNGWHLGQWASDYCLGMFDLTRDEAMTKLDLTAMLMGLSMRDPRAVAWLDEFYQHCHNSRLMNGSLHNRPGQEIVDPHSGVNYGIISADPRCRGHSREQVVAGILAHKHGLLPYTNPPEILQCLQPDRVPDERAVVQACGM